MEVAPLKNLFFIAVLKLDVKDSFRYNKEIERMGGKPLEYELVIYKHCLACILLTQTLPSMYFRVNWKMEKPMLCCFTWIVFIEVNFTVAFLLIRKTWDDRFTGNVGG